MTLYLILICIIAILLIIIINLVKKIKATNILYKTLQNDYNEWKEEFDFAKNEVKRCNEQISIYEKLQEDYDFVIINDKKIKIKPIYKGKRALIGDYDKWSSENTMKILKTYGITVDVVRSGKDIVEKIKHGYKCDIIFTNNIYKNGDSGSATLDKLKELKEFNTPVVIHTVSDNERHKFINIDGFDEYVVKPLNQDKVKPILDKFFQQNKKKKKI